MNERDSLFHEAQHIRQLWIWVLLLAIAVLSIWGAIQQLLLRTPFGNNPAPDSVIILLVIIFGAIVPLVFYFMNLTIEVYPDGLYYRFFPFHLRFRCIALENMVDCEACEYSPLKDYGGWGIRYGKKGKVYNVSGNRGVLIRLTNGDNVMFGSQRPVDFATTIKQAYNHS